MSLSNVARWLSDTWGLLSLIIGIKLDIKTFSEKLMGLTTFEFKWIPGEDKS